MPIRAPLLAVALSLAAVLFPLQNAIAQQQPDTTLHQLDTVRVEVSRLRSGGIPLGRTPFGAQVVTGAPLEGPEAATLAGALGSVVGISTASQFGSPVQPDLRFRGFQVGPVVGFPQSVSVFVDGVRVNEPDASQVNFDLIPMHVVERVEIVRTPGGPFGRNTLAGAINVVTRRAGASSTPSGSIELGGGSFSTASGAGWIGGGLPGGLDYLLSARYHDSAGWRDLSSTELRQLFAKVGYRGEATDAWLSYTLSDNFVEGPGSLPSSWLRGELPAELRGTSDPRRLQFTGFEGDFFEPRLHFLSGAVTRTVGHRLDVQVSGFLRSNTFSQFNDNITEANARGETDILSTGGALMVGGETGGGARWSGGLEVSRNDTDILIFEVANAAFPAAGGMTEQVSSKEDNFGGFAQLWWPVSSRAALSGSLRYDYVSLPVTDHLDPENSGENEFSQLTGSLGADFMISSALRVFGGYGRGFRAPVILEVSCADPEDPCPLPFELGADPPLDPVTTDTWQAGFRVVGRAASAELVGYWAEVHDDLFAVVLPPATRGYFTNLDRTRRQGVELSAFGRILDHFEVHGTVALTRATFQTEATLASALLDDDDDENDLDEQQVPDEDDDDHGAVAVRPGDRFAMVPGLTASAAIAYAPEGWRVELEGSYVGSQHYIGDENNEELFGKLDPYFVLGAEVERDFSGFSVYLRGENLLDADYATFGIISPNVRGPDEEPQPFLSPGLPFHLFAGVRYSF